MKRMHGLTLSLVVLSHALACSSDGEKRADGGDKAADAADVAVDAGAVTDAGEVPVVDAVVDAGHVGDGDSGAVVDGHAPVAPVADVADAGSVVVDPKNATKPQVPPAALVWNRVLLKAKSRDTQNAALQELVEDATKAKVVRTRRTAGTFWLVEFAPTDPARTQADQAKLIEALKATGAFDVVEGDQLMKLK